MTGVQTCALPIYYLGSPSLFLWLLHHLRHFRLVVSLHGGDVDGEPYRNRFNHWLFRAVLARAYRVTACSQALLDQALTLAPEIASKVKVIHNGVDVGLFATAPPYQHLRPYLLAVGQLEWHKGFDLLISAFAHVAKEFQTIDLLIVGEGSEHLALQAQIQAEGLGKQVHLLGAMGREQVASLMRSCMAMVIPSRREPFGIVALEARAAGKPIIATRVGGLPEALQGSSAMLVEHDDVLELQHALRLLLSGDEATLQVVSQLPKEFEWCKVSKTYLEVYGLRS